MIVARIIAILVLAASCLPDVARAQTQQRMALIIGNSDYDSDGVVAPQREPAAGMQYDLVNPANDVQAVASLLGETYNRPQPMLNMDFDAMSTALAQFAVDVSRADAAADAANRPRPVVVIYYAGHGMEYANTNYLIPVGARLPAPEEMQNVPANAARQRLQGRVIAVDDVLSLFEERGDGVTVLVIDACRNNPWARRARGGRTSAVEQGLATITPVGSLIVALSASPGAVASDGQGQTLSPFAQAFVEIGARRDLSFVDAFSSIVERVVLTTPNRQRPWMVGSPSGRFCLLQCASSRLSQPEIGPEAGSLEDWRTWVGDGRIYFEVDRFNLNASARGAR
ncbi:MAG: caspase family protein [Hyphomonadaceae bacterium JAD_PAG50586_4]|nr:MAG: caspase family protein [Hyphomonadaceae bacterium JAD_PAG50586_4]